MTDMVVLLGNGAPVEVHKPQLGVDNSTLFWAARARGEEVADWNGKGLHKVYTPNPEDSPYTTVVVSEETPFDDVLTNIKRAWMYHSTANPTYVLVSNKEDDPEYAALLQAALSRHYGISEPEGVTALTTTAGLDFVALQMAGAASATAIAKWCAITVNATAPAIGDTTLTGEIVTGGGGLIRQTGTYAHTVGTSTYTMTNTFTVNGSDTIPVTLAKAAYFNAAAAGTMVFETLISPTVTVSVVGDSMTLTDTVTV